MPALPVITFSQLCRAVERMGFYRTRQKGSYIRYVHADGRKTIIPDHGSHDVPKGLLVKIIKQDLNISVDEFCALCNLISKMIQLNRHVGRDCRHPEHKDVLGPLPSVASGFRQSLPERRF